MKPSCSTNITGGVCRHAGSLRGPDERSALVLLHGRSTTTHDVRRHLYPGAPSWRGATRAPCVCSSVTSATRLAYGLMGRRTGSSRRCPGYRSSRPSCTAGPSQPEGWQPGKSWHGASVMVGMKTHAAAAVLRARRDFARRDAADDQGDQVPPALYQRGQCPVVAAASPRVFRPSASGSLRCCR